MDFVPNNVNDSTRGVRQWMRRGLMTGTSNKSGDQYK